MRIQTERGDSAGVAQTGSPAFARAVAPSRPPHETVVAALEAGAADGCPFLTIHGREPLELDAHAALEGARRFGAVLHAHGVKRGDRVPILLPTSLEFAKTLLGCMTIGAIPVPLASPMTFGGLERFIDNLGHIVDNAGARCIVTYERVQKAIAESSDLRSKVDHVLTLDDLNAGTSTSIPAVSVGASDTALLQYTSGTTGRPKGAVISHGALVANAYAIVQGMDLGPHDVGVTWLPMFHDMGLIGVLLTAVCHPYPIHLIRPETFVMRPKRWLELMTKVGGTLAAAPNFAYELCVSRIREDAEYDLSAWKRALNGAEAVHAGTVDRFTARFKRDGFRPETMMPVYGMAESTLAVTFSDWTTLPVVQGVDRKALEQGRVVESSGDGAFQAVSVGTPVAGASVCVTDDAGTLVPERQVGEVRISGPSLMDGYFHNDSATAEVLSDGWLRSGDLGFMERGQLFIVGRAKEVIIRGGRNYYPTDIERIAGDIPGVGNGVAAFARVNEATGTEDLVVVAETGEKDGEARATMVKDIRGELLAILGVKADDVRLCAIGKLPRTTSGKIRRGENVLLVADPEGM